MDFKSKYIKYKKKYYNIKYGGSDGNGDNLDAVVDAFNSVIDKKNINEIIDDSGKTRLHIASLLGKTKTAELLIDSKASINKADKNDHTPLMIASLAGRTDMVNLLIKKKAAVEKADGSGGTALSIASFSEDTDVVNLLIESEADVNNADNQGVTPLHIASRYGNTDTARLLIERKARVNKVDNRGDTPLIKAVYNSYMTTIRLLVEFGADTTIRGYENKTAAELTRRYSIEKYLVNDAPLIRFQPSARNERGELYNVRGRAQRAATRDLVDIAGFDRDMMNLLNQFATGSAR